MQLFYEQIRSSEYYNNGSITNWSAVGGSAAQGAITGAAAGFTYGASLLVTTSASVAANAAGGAINNAIQGKQITTKSVATDATIGLVFGVAGHYAGEFVENSLDNLSRSAKGELGESITKLKYGIQGYKDEGKAVVETGGKTPTGRIQVAKYDFSFRNIFTGKNLTVESKFNGSKLTPNQAAAAPNVTTPGGLIIDRTTSKQLGNTVQSIITGSSGQFNNH